MPLARVDSGQSSEHDTVWCWDAPAVRATPCRVFTASVAQVHQQRGSTGPIGGAPAVAGPLEVLREKFSYFPKPEKSILLIPLPLDKETILTCLAEMPLQVKQGHCYVGGYLGPKECKGKWLQPQVDNWVVCVGAHVAGKFPHTAYLEAGHSLQGEWQYIQCMCTDVAEDFWPLKEVLWTLLFPALAKLMPKHHQLQAIGTKARALVSATPQPWLAVAILPQLTTLDCLSICLLATGH